MRRRLRALSARLLALAIAASCVSCVIASSTRTTPAANAAAAHSGSEQRVPPAPLPSPATGGAGAPSFIGVITAPTLDIKSEVDGTIRQMHFTEGLPVKAGQVLVQLDDRTEQLQVDAAQADLEQKLVQLKRAESVNAEIVGQGKANSEVEEAKIGQRIGEIAVKFRMADVARRRIAAPFEGVIARTDVREGQVIKAGGETLAVLVDLSHPGVTFAVPAQDAAGVRAGTSVRVQADGAKGTVPGRVTFVSPLVSPESGTVTIKASLDAATAGADALRPGAHAVVTLEPATP